MNFGLSLSLVFSFFWLLYYYRRRLEKLLLSYPRSESLNTQLKLLMCA